MSPDGPVVAALGVTPVKGLRIQSRSQLMLERSGVSENRRFYLVDARGRMVNGKQLGELSTVLAVYDDRARTLSLTFPGGRAVAGKVELDAPIRTTFFSRQRMATPVLGEFSQALSEHVGRTLRLVAADARSGAVDRGARGAVSLISRASLARLQRVAGEDELDARRFRMLIEIDGVSAHAEDEWLRHRVAIGRAVVKFTGHVGRCLVTSRDPDSGEIDLPTLDLLRSYRADAQTTEPLALGVYGHVLEAGLVRVGDPVVLE